LTLSIFSTTLRAGLQIDRKLRKDRRFRRIRTGFQVAAREVSHAPPPSVDAIRRLSGVVARYLCIAPWFAQWRTPAAALRKASYQGVTCAGKRAALKRTRPDAPMRFVRARTSSKVWRSKKARKVGR